MTMTPRHDTPHPCGQGFIQHVALICADGWFCRHCGVGHRWVGNPDKPGFGFLVAVEARPCPRSFETPCPDCGRCYECAPDCVGMASIFAGSLGLGVGGVAIR